MKLSRKPKITLKLMGMLLLFFLLPCQVSSVPMMSNYQGYLTDANGAPVNDTVSMTFGIYDAAEGGSALWTEIHESVTVTNGDFNVILGKTASFTGALFDGERYLGITVGAGEELTPRSKFTSVAFSIRTNMANTVVNGAITEEKIASRAVTSDKIADNAITNDKILAGGINGSKISDNSIDISKLNFTPLTSGSTGVNRNIISLKAGETITGAQTPVPVYLDKGGLIFEQAIGASEVSVYGVNRFAQTFQTDQGTTEINKVSLKLVKIGNPPGNFEVSIYGVDGDNFPIAPPLGAKSVLADNISDGWNDFDFDSPVSVSTSTAYAIVVGVPAGDGNANIVWKFSDANAYVGGHYFSNNSFGDNWTEHPESDFTFKMYGDNRAYACEANDTLKLDFIGFAITSGNPGENISVQVNGVVSGFESLSVGRKYYIQDTPGAIGTSPGVYKKLVAISINQTELTIFWADSIDIASLGEAVAGTDDTKIMTPLKTDQVISSKGLFGMKIIASNTSTFGDTSEITVPTGASLAIAKQCIPQVTLGASNCQEVFLTPVAKTKGGWGFEHSGNVAGCYINSEWVNSVVITILTGNCYNLATVTIYFFK